MSHLQKLASCMPLSSISSSTCKKGDSMPLTPTQRGYIRHAIIGALATIVLVAMGTPPFANVLAVTGVGVAHEVGDGDFTTAPEAPWNGIKDVAAFLPAPLLWGLFNWLF